MAWILCLLLLTIVNEVGGFEVSRSKFSYTTDVFMNQQQADQYCSDNGLGQLAAITYAHKKSQISELIDKAVDSIPGKNFRAFWVAGYTTDLQGGLTLLEDTTQDVPSQSYECITFSDFWDDLEDRFNFAHKTCDQLRNVICELQMSMQGPQGLLMSMSSGKRMMNHVMQRLTTSVIGQCAVACVEDRNCQSHNFNHVSQECELNDSGPAAMSDVATSGEEWQWTWY